MLPIGIAVGPIILAIAVGHDLLNPKEVISRRSSMELRIDSDNRLVVPHSTKPIKLSQTDRYLVKELCLFPGVKSVVLRQFYKGEFSSIAQCGNTQFQVRPVKKDALIQCLTEQRKMICPLVPSSNKVAAIQLNLENDADTELIQNRVTTLDISLARTNLENP